MNMDEVMQAERLRAATRTPAEGADISATISGGLAMFEPLTMCAERWLRAHAEDTWENGALLIEPRCVPAIAEGAIAAGLTFLRDAG
jgi:hypothetical protein